MYTQAKQVIAGALITATAICCPCYLKAADGLDASFGTSGITELNLSNRDHAMDVRVDSAGRIYVMGATDHGILGDDFDSDPVMDFSNLFLARFHSDGTKDLSFGGIGGSQPGTVVTDVQITSNSPVGVVPLSDGTIIAYSVQMIDSQPTLAMMRYLESGVLDSSFGVLGKRLIELPSDDGAGVGVELIDGQLNVWGARFAARMNLDGTMDPTYGVDGMVDISVVSGIDLGVSDAQYVDGTLICVMADRFNDELTFFRLDQNGNLMPGFGTGGTIVRSTASHPSSEGACFVVDDGMITYAVGNHILRMDFQGVLDETFGTFGVKNLLKNGRVTDIIRQHYGLITFGFMLNDIETQFAIGRLESDGEFDSTFGNANGLVWAGWLRVNSGLYPQISKLMTYANGKILAAGHYSLPVNPSIRNVTLMRTEPYNFEVSPVIPEGGGFTDLPNPTHSDTPQSLFGGKTQVGRGEMSGEPAELAEFELTDEELLIVELLQQTTPSQSKGAGK